VHRTPRVAKAVCWIGCESFIKV